MQRGRREKKLAYVEHRLVTFLEEQGMKESVEDGEKRRGKR